MCLGKKPPGLIGRKWASHRAGPVWWRERPLISTDILNMLYLIHHRVLFSFLQYHLEPSI